MSYSNASPLEILAFYKLGLLNASDIEPIFLGFLERNLGDYEVACLASEPTTSISYKRREIEAALKEVVGDETLSELEALWLTMRYYLKRIVQSDGREHELMHPIIKLVHGGYPALFERPETNYACREYGIERLYGVYYSRDDKRVLSRKILRQLNAEIKTEAAIVLRKFYSSEAVLPSDLFRVQSRS